jgi:[acyl-carrier-protein] S-malonyltransferase
MKPAAEQLRAALGTIQVKIPVLPVLHNADVASHNDPDAIRDALARQLYSPVRWVETVQAMAAQGILLIAECAPGKVLAGLNKRIVEGVTGMALADAAALADTLEKIKA